MPSQRAQAAIPFHSDTETNGDARQRLEALSPREREVLSAALAGKPTRQICDELCISVKTVEFHRARIREKLGVTSLAVFFRLFLPSASDLS